MSTDKNILTIWYELGEIKHHIVNYDSESIDIDKVKNLLDNIKDQLDLIKNGKNIIMNPEDFDKFDELDLGKKSRIK